MKRSLALALQLHWWWQQICRKYLIHIKMKRSCWTRLPIPSVLCVKCSSKIEYKKTGWQSVGVCSAMWIRVKYAGMLPAVPTQGPFSRLPAAWLHACLLPGYALRLKFPKITNNDKFNCKTALY